MLKNQAQLLVDIALTKCKEAILFAEDNNLTDEQFFINFEDELNYMSQIDHTVGIK